MMKNKEIMKHADTTTSPEAPKFKFLAIKNWTKFQSGKYHQKSLNWHKDYSNQIDDREYSKLTLLQRAVLQECRRLRARLAHNIPNDTRFIATASAIPS